MLLTLLILTAVSLAVALVCVALLHDVRNQLRELRLDTHETHALLCDWLMEQDEGEDINLDELKAQIDAPVRAPMDGDDYTWSETHAD